MKLHKRLYKAFIILIFSHLVYSQSRQQEYGILQENYGDPRNIMFIAMHGGSSHITWVFSFLDELSRRGHNITYVTRDFHKHFADPYPHFNTVVLGGEPSYFENVYQNHKHPSKSMKAMVGQPYSNFKTDYPAFKQIILEQNIDLLVCDFGSSVGCIEASKRTNVPYISTMAFAMTKDAGAPYVNNGFFTRYDTVTLDMTFGQRFWDKFLVLPTLLFDVYSEMLRHYYDRKEAGVADIAGELSLTPHTDSLKIVNSLYGVEAARPLGPLVEMVGPIIPRKYPVLTPDLKEFLDNHKRIIYIAFGQHAIASKKDLTLLLTSILENVESGVYDGFLWGFRRNSTELPETVRTKSGNVYSTKDILNQKYSNMKFVRWVPQVATMMHPSVIVFLTHGGAGSFYEGLYAGKRLLVFPFFADQPGNAFTVERNGLGGFLRFDGTQEAATKLMEYVGLDATGEIQKNVNRFKALIQIHSKHGSLRAADLVEEVLYTHKDTFLPHRYEVSRQMSFIRAYNIDLYAAAIFILLISSISTVYFVTFICKKFIFYSPSNLKKKVE